MKICAEEVCGIRRKGCEWWNDSIEGYVREGRELFQKFLQTTDRRTHEIYKRKRIKIKWKIKEAKKEADER